MVELCPHMAIIFSLKEYCVLCTIEKDCQPCQALVHDSHVLVDYTKSDVAKYCPLHFVYEEIVDKINAFANDIVERIEES